jgi:hypothetical protein
MFGAVTPQPSAVQRNGFLALAVFDKKENGGNENARIDQADAVFPRLRIWIDKNCDGVSQSSELFTLTDLAITSISLDYRESSKRDPVGNLFRYRSPVTGEAIRNKQWAWDVYLKSN